MKIKRLMIGLLLVALLTVGCANITQPGKKQYTATYLDLFDTVTTVTGWADSEKSFQAMAQQIHDDLQLYHRLFDIYNDYEGVANLKTVNDNAGVAPVLVDRAVIDFLLACKTYYDLTEGKVNVAMGSVLQLWHTARSHSLEDPQGARIPDSQALQMAAEHMDFSDVVVDKLTSTVYIIDPQLRLDVGAVAKGWAAQRVAESAPTGLLISVGGNVCATGPKTEQGAAWVIGIQDPNEADKNLHTLYLTKGSVVTSGDYQRYFVAEGQKYHHIIDPATQMPATLWRSVSIICEDSGLADALSTGLFLMDLEQGKALASECGAEVLWVDRDGREFMTPGFESKLRS